MNARLTKRYPVQLDLIRMTDLTDTLRELRTEVNSNVFDLKYFRRQSAVFIHTKEEVMPSMLLFCGAIDIIYKQNANAICKRS